MKNLLLLTFLLFTIIASARPGYLITVTHNGETIPHLITDFNHVNDIIELRFAFRVDEKKCFLENNFFDIRMNNTLIYCEKGELVRTKKGKVKFKKKLKISNHGKVLL